MRKFMKIKQKENIWFLPLFNNFIYWPVDLKVKLAIIL